MFATCGYSAAPGKKDSIEFNHVGLECSVSVQQINE